MTEPERPLLQMRGIVKEFPGVRALDEVDLDVAAGEVHCLLGQNGAGKSTLIKVLAGAYRPDAGEIRWAGSPIVFGSPHDADAAGIATIHQELDLVPGLSVAENVFLGHEPGRFGFSRPRAAEDAARALLARLGHPEIPPRRELGRLSAAGQQVVSMARALSRDARLIVMDEPSAVLDADEVDNLFRVVRELTAAGVAVVYISHRLEEIRRIGDRVTVLKDGRTVARNLPAPQTPTAEVIRLMTGRTIEYVFPERGPTPTGDVRARGRRARPARRVRRRVVHRARRRGRGPGRARRLRPVGDPGDGLRGAPVDRRAPSRFGDERCGRVGAGGGAGRDGARARGAQEPGAAAGRAGVPQRLPPDARPLRPRGLPARRRRARGGGRGHRAARRPPGRPDAPGAHAVGRQPAEGRARALAAGGVLGAAARRAHPRRRRRGAQRDLRADPAAGRARRGRGAGVERGPRGARAGRPGAGGARGTGGARGAGDRAGRGAGARPRHGGPAPGGSRDDRTATGRR